MIAENASPPVCKIIDYGKYRYSIEKKKKEQKKKAKTTEVKEVKMSYKIEAHDYGVRLKQISRFLEEGDRVSELIMGVTTTTAGSLVVCPLLLLLVAAAAAAIVADFITSSPQPPS